MAAIKPEAGKALAALTAAALCLPGLNPQAATPSDDIISNVSTGHYQESNHRMTVDVYHVDALVPLTKQLELSFSMDRDTYSGASPGYSLPTTMTNQLQYVTTVANGKINTSNTTRLADIVSSASPMAGANMLTSMGLASFLEWQNIYYGAQTAIDATYNQADTIAQTQLTAALSQVQTQLATDLSSIQNLLASPTTPPGSPVAQLIANLNATPQNLPTVDYALAALITDQAGILNALGQTTLTSIQATAQNQYNSNLNGMITALGSSLNSDQSQYNSSLAALTSSTAQQLNSDQSQYNSNLTNLTSSTAQQLNADQSQYNSSLATITAAAANQLNLDQNQYNSNLATVTANELSLAQSQYNSNQAAIESNYNNQLSPLTTQLNNAEAGTNQNYTSQEASLLSTYNSNISALAPLLPELTTTYNSNVAAANATYNQSAAADLSAYYSQVAAANNAYASTAASDLSAYNSQVAAANTTYASTAASDLSAYNQDVAATCASYNTSPTAQSGSSSPGCTGSNSSPGANWQTYTNTYNSQVAAANNTYGPNGTAAAADLSAYNTQVAAANNSYGPNSSTATADYSAQQTQIASLNATQSAAESAAQTAAQSAYQAANPFPGTQSVANIGNAGGVTINFNGLAGTYFGDADLAPRPGSNGNCYPVNQCYEESGMVFGVVADYTYNLASGDGSNHFHTEAGVVAGDTYSIGSYNDGNGIYFRAQDGGAFALNSLYFSAPINTSNPIYGANPTTSNYILIPDGSNVLGPNEYWQILGFNSATPSTPSNQVLGTCGTAVCGATGTGGPASYPGLVVAEQTVPNGFVGQLTLNAGFDNVNSVWIHYNGWPISDSFGVQLFHVNIANVNISTSAAVTTYENSFNAYINNYMVNYDANYYINTYVPNLNSINNNYNTEMSTLETQLNTAIATANSTYSAEQTALQATLTSTLNSDQTNYNNQIAALQTTLNSALSSEQTTYNNEIAALQTTLNTTLSNDQATYNSELTGLQTTLNSTLSSDQTNYNNEIAGLQTTLNSTLSSLQTTYNAQYNALSASNSAEITTLNNQYQTDLANLQSQNTAAITALTNTYNAQTAPIIAAENAALNSLTSQNQAQVAAINAYETAQQTTLTSNYNAQVAAINAAEAAQQSTLSTQYNAQVAAINATETAQQTTLTNNYNAQVAAINAAEAAQQSALSTQYNAQTTALKTAETTQQTALTNGYNTLIAAINAAETSQQNALISQQNTQIAALNAAVSSQQNTITSQYNAQVASINSAVSTQQNSLSSQQNTQISAINATYTAEINAANTTYSSALSTASTTLNNQNQQALISAFSQLLNTAVPTGTPTVQRFQTQPLETRSQPQFNLKYYLDSATLGVSGGLSDEPDYLSNFGSVNYSHEFNDKRTTLSGSYGLTSNFISRNMMMMDMNGMNAPSMGPTNYPTLAAHSLYNAFGLSLSQILSKNTLFQSSINYTNQSGYLSNPYKEVYIRGIITPAEYAAMYLSPATTNWSAITNLQVVGVELFRENRPDYRNIWSFSNQVNHHMPDLDATLHFDYRYYIDDWGINSHTFQFKWYQAAPWGITVTPTLRYYSQSQADFFAPYFLAPRADGYYSSDYRLSAFGELSGGLILSKKFAKGIKLDTGFEYVVHAGGLKLGGGGTGSYADFDYMMAHANLSVDLSAKLFSDSGDGGGEHAMHHHHHHGAPLPAGVMFGHMMSQSDEMMVGYRFMWNKQSGSMLNGSTPVSNQTLLNNACPGKLCLYTPTSMSMEMHMLDFMYAPTDWLNLMLMPQLVSMKMHMNQSLTGVPDTVMPMDGMVMSSNNLGDTIITALVKALDEDGHHVHVGVGVSAPTGNDNIKIGGSAYSQDYGMQTGSGTWDFKPSLTYTGQSDDWGWGAQFSGVKRMQTNKYGYALGNIFQATAWGSYQIFDWLSASIRGVYTQQNSIQGQTSHAMLDTSSTNYTSNYGGRFVDAGIGLNAYFHEGQFAGHNLSFEWLQPVSTDFNGYQLDRSGALSVSWNYAF